MCFNDSEGTSMRALSSASYADGAAMTDEACINFCIGKGYIYAGTEYSAECCELLFLDSCEEKAVYSRASLDLVVSWVWACN